MADRCGRDMRAAVSFLCLWCMMMMVMIAVE